MFAADHLSRIENDETTDDSDVDDNFPRETLMEITTNDPPWFADFANYLVGPETHSILDQCHHGPTGGHYGPNTTAKKVLDSDFYWPTIIKEAHTLVRLCEACQKTGNVLKRDEITLNSIQALRNCNPDLIAASEKRMFQLHELDELDIKLMETLVYIKLEPKSGMTENSK
ncbi:reverse transcriptase domain-containing protein [Tanacetum coccineum]|uniref:Reverse transcriptase domain-containing protein n=1 Tax=Tanacetum coccineum TaxID=301880 RepID=A0ABQ5AY56_9ASTR